MTQEIMTTPTQGVNSNGANEVVLASTGEVADRAVIFTDPREMLIPRNQQELGKLAQAFSRSGMYAAENKQLTPEQCVVIILTGIDLGLTPTQAMRGIKVIKGQPAPSADTLVACVRRRKDVCKYIQVLESTTKIVRMAGMRLDDSQLDDLQPTIAQFTIEDAAAAGLVNAPGGMYQKYPEQMLYARCAVKLIRRLWPDVALGLYTPDELKSGVVTEEEAEISASVEPIRQITHETVADAPKNPLPVEAANTQPVAAQPSEPAADENQVKMRVDLNARIRALESNDQFGYKSFSQKMFGTLETKKLTIEQMTTANRALDALRDDPFTSLVTLADEWAAVEQKGHGDS